MWPAWVSPVHLIRAEHDALLQIGIRTSRYDPLLPSIHRHAALRSGHPCHVILNRRAPMPQAHTILWSKSILPGSIHLLSYIAWNGQPGSRQPIMVGQYLDGGDSTDILILPGTPASSIYNLSQEAAQASSRPPEKSIFRCFPQDGFGAFELTF